MAGLRTILLFVTLMVALVASVPIPEPGGWGGKHEHYIIHVPYHVHTVHHTHVKKVHVPVPVYKEKIIYKHIHHHDDHHDHYDHHEPWW